MNLDMLSIRLMAHARRLKTRMQITDPDDGETTGDRKLHVRPSSDGKAVELLRQRHPSEGTGCDLRMIEPDEALAVGMAMLDRMDRLHRREATLAEHGFTCDAPPSWALRVDGSTLSVLGALGLDAAETLNPPDGKWEMDRVRFVRHIAHPRLNGTRITRVGMDCHLQTTVHTTPARTVEVGTWWYEHADDDRPRIGIVSRSSLPALTLAGAVGKPLSRLIAMPGVEMRGIVVDAESTVDARSGLHTIRASMHRETVALAPPPAGVDTSWMEEREGAIA